MSRLSVTALLFLLCQHLSAAEPQPFTLDYQASYGALAASATRTLVRSGDGNWELHSQMEVKMLGATMTGIDERSRFGWHDERPQSLQYRYTQKGLGHRERGLDFDAGGLKAQWRINDKQGELGLTPPVFDSLNSLLALRQQVAAGSKDFTLQVADKSEVSPQRYQVVESVGLSVPAGTFDTVHLRRVRDGDSKRTTDLWLAPALDHAVVKFVQTEPDGDTITLQLKKGQVGTTSLPLPR